MYEITLNGKTLYHPNSTDCIISNAVIHEALNDAGYMDITIPFSNPLFNEIEERKGSVIVYKDNVPIWYGQINEVSIDFSKNKTLYVVGEAAYLNDTVQPQKLYDNKTKYEIFSSMLEEHNKMVDPDKQFEPGIVGHNDIKPMTVITNWEYTLDSIRSNLCEDQEYIRVRHLGGVRYLDIMPLENYGKRTDQSILFGDNMLDYTEKSTSSGIATICIPLGSRLDESPIEDVDAYVTCESANGGKNYVELPGAVNRLGRITRVVHFDVLDSPSALVTAATNWLQSAQYSKLTLELSAVDLSVLHSDIDNYAVGDYVRAICEPMGMDSWFPIRERDTDLINLANNKVVVGAEHTKSITTQQNEKIDNLEKIIPDKESILSTALRNASNMINANGENGNVSMRLDSDGKPYEILIMNAESIEQSTQAWRWNLSGFGHGTKAAGDPIFTWESDVAMTMDGQIIAKTGSVAGFKMYTDQILDGDRWNYLESAGGKVRLGSRTDGSFGQIWLNGNTVLTENMINLSDYVTYTYLNSSSFKTYIKDLVWIFLKYAFKGSGGSSFADATTGTLVMKGYNLNDLNL